MAIFPASPTVGQTTNVGNISWSWNGAAWDALPITTYSSDPVTIVASSTIGTIAIDCITAPTVIYTTASTASFVLNFRGNATTTLNNAIGVDGRSTVMTFVNTTGAATTSYPTAIQVDGVSVTTVTTLWQGGSAPTAGSASARDVYTFVITRTTSANWLVFASQTKYA
jgi:hypothetical protein